MLMNNWYEADKVIRKEITLNIYYLWKWNIIHSDIFLLLSRQRMVTIEYSACIEISSIHLQVKVEGSLCFCSVSAARTNPAPRYCVHFITFCTKLMEFVEKSPIPATVTNEIVVSWYLISNIYVLRNNSLWNKREWSLAILRSYSGYSVVSSNIVWVCRCLTTEELTASVLATLKMETVGFPRGLVITCLTTRCNNMERHIQFLKSWEVHVCKLLLVP